MPILYSNITLLKATSTFALWRTLKTSSRGPTFFADHVGVLCVAESAYTPHLAEILRICINISSLTFWTIPTSLCRYGSLAPSTSQTTSPRLFIDPLKKCPTTEAVQFPLFPTEAFDTIRPKQIAASFRTDGTFFPHPNFSQPLFTFVTHLSVLNPWEDWTYWDNFDQLPSLTHLALDLNLALRRSSRPVNRKDRGQVEHDNDAARRALVSKLRHILQSCPKLQVCVLVLLFDNMPLLTVNKISCTFLTLGKEEEHAFPFINPTLDPRLVFVQNTESLRTRRADSEYEAAMWKKAEARVVEQSTLAQGVCCLPLPVIGNP